MNNELNLSEEQIQKIKKQFSSVTNVTATTVTIHDWLDDSVQIVKVA